MQKMNVRFSDEIKVAIQELSDETGESFSDVARNAMDEGIFYLKEHLRFCKEELPIKEGDAHKQQDLLK